MKLILVHGSLQVAVLRKVETIKKGFDALSITEVSDSLAGFNISSPSLFTQNRLVVLENPDIKSLEKMLQSNDPDLTILIKFSKALEKSSPVLKKIIDLKGEVAEFSENNQTSIFPFLDNLGNLSKNALKEFEKNYQEFGGQYLLTMYAYFLRRLILQPKSGSEFIRQKINSQKKNFPESKIKFLYKEIIETDYKIKQGLTEEKLALTLLTHKILTI